MSLDSLLYDASLEFYLRIVVEGCKCHCLVLTFNERKILHTQELK